VKEVSHEHAPLRAHGGPRVEGHRHTTIPNIVESKNRIAQRSKIPSGEL